MKTYIDVRPRRQLVRVSVVPERGGDVHGRRDGLVGVEVVVGVDRPGGEGQVLKRGRKGRRIQRYGCRIIIVPGGGGGGGGGSVPVQRLLVRRVLHDTTPVVLLVLPGHVVFFFSSTFFYAKEEKKEEKSCYIPGASYSSVSFSCNYGKSQASTF